MFRIVITEETEKEVTTQVWQTDLYDTQEEAEAAGATSRHGYVDKKETVIQQTQMLDQRVKELNLPAVIKAVNNLDLPGNGNIGEFMLAGNIPPTPSKPETEGH